MPALGAEQAPAAASPAPAPVLPAWSTLIRNANEAQRERMYRFLANKYPTFASDIWALIVKNCPDFGTAVWPRIDILITTKYVGVAELAENALRESPQVQQAVTDLILEKYPTLVDEIRSLANEPNLNAAVAQLIRIRHPELLVDIYTLLYQQYPRLLQEMKLRIVVKYPGLIADVADILTARYPQLSAQTQQLVAAKYPTLVQELFDILAQPDPAQQPAADTPAFAAPSATP